MTTLAQPPIIIDSQTNAAKFAGFAYLLTFVIVVFANFGIYNKLIFPDDAVKTARAILASQQFFRTGMLLDLVYAIGFTILLGSLYVILKNVNNRVAVLAALLQLVYLITWVSLTMKFFDALRLAIGTHYMQVFDKESALSRLFLSARFDRYYGTLMFYSLGSTIFNYLWYRSGYIPRMLAISGIIACAWCFICATAFLIYPDFQNVINLWLFDLPMAFFDITLSFWLLIKGLKQP